MRAIETTGLSETSARHTSGNHMFPRRDGPGRRPVPEKCYAGWELERPEQQLLFFSCFSKQIIEHCDEAQGGRMPSRGPANKTKNSQGHWG